MKLTKNFMLKVVTEVIGEEAATIVEFLKDKTDISEFVIADKTDTEIHFVRNILYRLHNENMATYMRKKDRIKGWYISYWTLNPPRFREVYTKHQQSRVDKLKQKLEKEQEYREGLYICPNLCSRMNHEAAMEASFKCHECGRVLHLQDNQKTIERLKGMIAELEMGVA